MTYHRRNKKRINKKNVFLVFLIAALLFFGFYIKNVVQWTAIPVIKTKNVIVQPFKSSIDYFKFKKDLINKNDELNEENRRLKIENLTVKSLQLENESLKQILDYKDENQEIIVSEVLNQPPFSPYDTFVIDAGSSDNVLVGDNVFYLGVLIGRIEETYLNTSIVRLYSSSGEVLFVSISDQETEAIGLGGGGFIITLPKDLEIDQDEVIFVGGNPIGKIDSIEIDETGAFKNIYFRYPFNVNKVDFVEIFNSQK